MKRDMRQGERKKHMIERVNSVKDRDRKIEREKEKE